MNLQGKRVIVKIRNRSKYATGCADALEGMAGTVTGSNDRADAWLVQFDKPAPTWWTHQTPARAFWFPASDLSVTA